MNTAETLIKTEPSKLRKYFVEYVVALQVVAIVYLVNNVNALNNFIREKFVTMQMQSNDALYKSANATEQFLNWQHFTQPQKTDVR